MRGTEDETHTNGMRETDDERDRGCERESKNEYERMRDRADGYCCLLIWWHLCQCGSPV